MLFARGRSGSTREDRGRRGWQGALLAQVGLQEGRGEKGMC